MRPVRVLLLCLQDRGYAVQQSSLQLAKVLHNIWSIELDFLQAMHATHFGRKLKGVVWVSRSEEDELKTSRYTMRLVGA